MAWRWAYRSVTGTSHAESGLPCQDAAICDVISTDAGEWLVIVVADGAGSASRSDAGSAKACETFSTLAARHLNGVASIATIDDNKVSEWLAVFHEAVQEMAFEHDIPLREFASTLLMIVVGEEDAFYLQLGDGAIAYATADRAVGYVLAEWPDTGEYENQTYFLTDSPHPDRFRCGRIPGRVEEVAVLTDGLQRLALDYATRQPHAPFFAPFFGALSPVDMDGEQEELSEALGRILDSGHFNARTNDDKTLVIASRRAAMPDAMDPPNDQPADVLRQ